MTEHEELLDSEPTDETEEAAEADEMPAGEADAPEPAAEEALPAVDLNTATMEELQQLPGIGEALAARIVNYRVEVQPFEEPIEITAVPGVSEAMYDRISERLTVSPVEPEAAVTEAEADVEEMPEPEPEAADIEEGAEFEPEPADVERPPEPEREPAPLVIMEPDRGSGVAAFLAVGLVSAIVGAALALAILFFVNGTLDFQTATDRALRAEAFRLEGEMEALGTEVEQLQGRMDTMQDLTSLVEEAQADIQILSRDLAATQAQVESLTETADTLRQEFTNLREDLDGMAEHVGMLEGGLREAEERLAAVEERLAIVSREVRTLRQTAERFDAFLNGLRELLGEAGGPSRPAPTVTRTPFPTPTPWETPTPKPDLTVIPLATPTPTQ
jgi:competence ComEA-like helix-hairpin-helix protein